MSAVPCGAIILAAGASSRMGRPKALLTLPAGDSFITRLATTFKMAGVDEVIAVLGYHGDLVRVHLDAWREKLRTISNPDPSRGQLSSLLVGLDELERRECGGALVMPVDQPLVTPATIHAVVTAWRGSGAAIVRPRQDDGRHGHPTLFDRRTWPDLRQADLAHGARPVVAAWATACGDVPVSDAGAFEDIDTPEEYDRILRG